MTLSTLLPQEPAAIKSNLVHPVAETHSGDFISAACRAGSA